MRASPTAFLAWAAFAALACTLFGCSAHPGAGASGGDEAVLFPYPADGGTVEWDGWAGEFVQDYCVQCHNPAANCTGSGCHPAAGALLPPEAPLPPLLPHAASAMTATAARPGPANHRLRI